jgi:hypothetical protein
VIPLCIKINFILGPPKKLAGKTLYQEKEVGMTDERKAHLTNNPSGTRSKIVVLKEALFRLFQKFNVLLGYCHDTKREKEAIAFALE